MVRMKFEHRPHIDRALAEAQVGLGARFSRVLVRACVIGQTESTALLELFGIAALPEPGAAERRCVTRYSRAIEPGTIGRPGACSVEFKVLLYRHLQLWEADVSSSIHPIHPSQLSTLQSHLNTPKPRLEHLRRLHSYVLLLFSPLFFVSALLYPVSLNPNPRIVSRLTRETETISISSILTIL